MKISILIPNLATNHIVRVWPVLKALERQHEVEVIGSLMGDEEIFSPYASECSYKVVRWRKPGHIISGLKQVQTTIGGDLVYAFQPLTASFGAALLSKVRRHLPVILDITDWEVWGMYRYGGGLKHALNVARHMAGPGWFHPNSLKYRYIADKLIPLADAMTVVATFLQKRYGGVLLRHGPDTTVFDPVLYDRRALRDKWGLGQDVPLVAFAGTPSKWKGVDDLLAALDLVSVPKLRLLMAGKSFPHAAERVLHVGYQPHSVMPELLAMADLVVLPQKLHPMAEAQIPAKVFEAMAMARPVVATAVGDLPEVLGDGCGVVVEAENVPRLAEAIQKVLTNKQRAEEMGWRARDKCVREYSWDAIARVLETVLRPFC